MLGHINKVESNVLAIINLPSPLQIWQYTRCPKVNWRFWEKLQKTPKNSNVTPRILSLEFFSLEFFGVFWSYNLVKIKGGTLWNFQKIFKKFKKILLLTLLPNWSKHNTEVVLARKNVPRKFFTLYQDLYILEIFWNLSKKWPFWKTSFYLILSIYFCN